MLSRIESRTDERTKGFQTKKLQELRDAFVEAGHVDEREVLGVEDLEREVLARVAASIRAGRVETEEVLRLTRSLWWALERGESPDSDSGSRSQRTTGAEESAPADAAQGSLYEE